MEFWKQYCVATLADAFETGDTKDICQAVLLSAMDESNRVTLRMSITQAIARLTNQTQRSIQKALQALEAIKFGRLEDTNTYVVSSLFASKSKEPPKTGFGLPEFSKEFEIFLAEFHVIFDMKKTIRRMKKKENDMSLLIQTLTRQLETKDQQLETKDQQIDRLLMLVEKIAGGKTVTADEAIHQLRLIQGGKE